jgi:type IV pilus assembly protein PilX
MRQPALPFPARHQSGAALIIGLLLLLVLTVLAISGMSTSTLELQMAGNQQYSERAFQAADTAIETAVSCGLYNTNIPTEAAACPAASVDPSDSYDFILYFEPDGGATAVPGGGYSLGSGFQAYHFIVDATGTSGRGATARHSQSFYIIGPGGT